MYIIVKPASLMRDNNCRFRLFNALRNRVTQGISFLAKFFPAVLLVCCQSVYGQVTTEIAIARAHEQLWAKFVDGHGLMVDFVGERPSAFDCRLSRPNAFGWGTPIANSTFFAGMYLVAMSNKAQATGKEADRSKARTLAKGLLKASSVSVVPGFISRGFATDGQSHYPNGSNDQTIPWFMGLYRYLGTDIPTLAEKQEIRSTLIRVGEALRNNDWRFPGDGIYTGTHRDDLRDNRFLEVPCFLYLLRMMHDLTDDQTWLALYQRAALEKPVGSTRNRLEICAAGIAYDLGMWGKNRDFLWIYVAKQACLAELIHHEKNPSFLAAFREGIESNRQFVTAIAQDFMQFDNADPQPFKNAQWREMYKKWFPQFDVKDAIEVAELDETGKLNSRRKQYERRYMTNPLAAISIIGWAGDIRDRGLIEKVIRHYDYSKLYLSEFLYAEYAYYLP
jgi:hypothetical protein